MNNSTAQGSRSILITEGEWKGWYSTYGDPFNSHAGPFFWREDQDRGFVCAMRVETQHLNGGGLMHGGAIMTFADYSLYVFSGSLRDGAAVTISLNGDFVGPALRGDVIECAGEVIKRTKRMVFLRGLMKVSGSPIFAYSAVMKALSGEK